MTSTIRFSILAAAFPILLAACSADETDGWGGTVETRADGVVVVRNPEKGAWPAGAEWRVQEDLRIGTAGGRGAMLFGDVAAVEADSLGRIWVLERQAKELRVFDARGRHVRTIGREGGGPGEFRDPVGLAWAPDGTIWVVDPAEGRFTVFDSAGLFIDTHPRRIAGYSLPWRGGFGRDGLLYEIAMVPGRAANEHRMSLLRFNAGMEPADTFALPTHRGDAYELRRGEKTVMAAGVPFAAGQVMAFDPRGFVWTGVNDRYRFAQQRPNGDTVRIVERQAAAVPVTAAERDEAVAGMKWFTDQGGRVDAGRIPGTKPAFEQIIVAGDSGVWVRPARPAGEEEGAAFDVFDAEGRYQGRVRVPGGVDAFPPPVFRGGALYGVSRDSLGVPFVVRARIVKGG